MCIGEKDLPISSIKCLPIISFNNFAMISIINLLNEKSAYLNNWEIYCNVGCKSTYNINYDMYW